MNRIRQSLGYTLPVFGGDLPVCHMWERSQQDTQTPFVREVPNIK